MELKDLIEPPTSTTLVQKASNYARTKHFGQRGDEGRDYYTAHIMQVVHILHQVTNDEETIAAAYLHDTIEDTDATAKELEKLFGQRVADLVCELTHEGDKDKGYTFPRLQSKKAILIKFADRLSNLSRMEAWPEQRQEHYLRKSVFWNRGQNKDGLREMTHSETTEYLEYRDWETDRKSVV